MAASVLGRPPVLLDDLVRELRWPDDVDVGLVEGVGGPRSPLAEDGDTVDLVGRLVPDLVVLVADAALGTINAVRLCLAALAGHRTVVVLNRYDGGDDLHRRNRSWLADECLVITDIAELASVVRASIGVRDRGVSRGPSGPDRGTRRPPSGARPDGRPQSRR
jgi:dethiobiotin synthetase